MTIFKGGFYYFIEGLFLIKHVANLCIFSPLNQAFCLESSSLGSLIIILFYCPVVPAEEKRYFAKPSLSEKRYKASMGQLKEIICAVLRVTTHSSHGIRLILQILLLAIFLHFFGLPAVEKYEKGEVMVVETSKHTDGIPLPAITIGVAYEAVFEDRLHNICFPQNKSIANCIQTQTPNVSSILKNVLQGYKKRKELSIGKKEIIEDFTATRAGRLFTLNFPLKIGHESSVDQIFLSLKPDFVKIMLHDPDYFIFNDNPVGLPTALTVFDVKTMFSHYHRVALTEVQELDLPTDPCNNDQSYNFNSCVRRNLAQKVKHS